MNAIVGQGILAMLIAGLAGAFAMAFSSPAETARTLERIRRRRNAFRFGGFVIVAGVVGGTLADAILVTAGLARDDPRFTTPVAVGYALIVVGVAILDAVLWIPERAGLAPPAAARVG